ncbi:uncharacterized protein LOC110887720 [Helianthus annuus]|uniref:uncharacterized protein LOC110887720 n=1 Tax=Helianthus annuus TaxID=4232 RepID=UPI000B9087ED|nr:uncharacterized protein LOC110887720 [Helianthus annuus]
MANSDETAVDRVMNDVTHANEATIVSLRISESVLQTMVDATVGKAVKKAMKKFKEPQATRSQFYLGPHFLTRKEDLVHTSNAKDKLKRKREEKNSQSSIKKNKRKSNQKPVCKTCKKCHYGKCRFEPKSRSQPRVCGICKSGEHTTLDCGDMENAVCFGCNEKGHIKTTCPKYVKRKAANEGKPKNESA